MTLLKESECHLKANPFSTLHDAERDRYCQVKMNIKFLDAEEFPHNFTEVTHFNSFAPHRRLCTIQFLQTGCPDSRLQGDAPSKEN